MPRQEVPLNFEVRPPEAMARRAAAFCDLLQSRRSVRDFAPTPVSRDLIELAVRTAGSAPSGANRQPWRFVAVDDPVLKRRIREAAEKEEYKSYHDRMPETWLEALEPLGTDWRKPFLERAPWLVACFAEPYGIDESGARRKNYYVSESVGIACGIFIAAIHNMGLATLTHTPSPMGFLNKILGRPDNERPFILFPVGYPAPGATVPEVERKTIDDILLWKTRTGDHV